MSNFESKWNKRAGVGGLWKPASAYTLNRRRFHHMVFIFRALLWLVVALFSLRNPANALVWISWGAVLLVGWLVWRRPSWMEVLNQFFIVTDLILISLAVRMSGGLASQAYLLYTGEALFLTAYGTLRYSLAGGIAVTVAYGLATGAWDAKLFWWRVVIMGIYLLASGGLGREYRMTRAKIRENDNKLEQLSHLRVLQDSIVQEQDIHVVLSRLLEESRGMIHADVAYIIRLDPNRRVTGLVMQGLATPKDIDLSSGPVPSHFRIVGAGEVEEWQWPLHQLLQSAGMKTLALVPLSYEESFYGWMGLAVTTGEDGFLTQEFIIQALADVTSTQLRFQESQEVAAKRGQLLAILERVGRIVNRNLDMDQLLQGLRQAVSEVLEIDSFFVALTLPEDPEHCLMQYLWDDGEEYPPEVLPLEPQGLTGSVITTGNPLLLNGQQQFGMLTGSQKEPRGMLVVPLMHEGRVLGAISAQSYRIEYDPDHLEFLSAIASQASIAIRNAQMYQQTQEIALTDYLTGLGNSRRFNIVMQTAVEVALETGQELALLLIDSDSLKSINDRFGHRAGDLHLQRVSQVIREHIREDDIACRYAGDEFVVLLPKSGLEDAVQVGERIRREIETIRFHWGDSVIIGSTISVGAAEFHAGMTADALFQAADHAMYLAKQNGKNRVAKAQ